MGHPPADGTAAARPRIRLDTIFVTGPGGHVLEIPADVAARYVVTPERVRALGHLPITPYGQDPLSGGLDEEEEVGGRHQTLQPSGAMGYHSDTQYGAYVWTDGHVYIGDHYHAGTEMGVIP